MPKLASVVADNIERVILVVRGHKVILDADLAAMYGVEAKVLNQAVKRNLHRFPADFMFKLTADEARRSRSQIVTLNAEGIRIAPIFTAPGGDRGRGKNIKYRPYAFTEQGVAMLSSVLRSPRAVQVNIEIMRAFVRLRQILQANAELARKLEALERKYDAKFRVVFDAIRELMAPSMQSQKRIGFGADRVD